MDHSVQVEALSLHEALWRLGSTDDAKWITMTWFTASADDWARLKSNYDGWRAEQLTPDLFHVHRLTVG